MSLRRFYYTFPCHLLFPETTGLQTLIYEIGILLFRNGGRFFLYHKIPCPPLREEGEWGTVAAPPPGAPKGLRAQAATGRRGRGSSPFRITSTSFFSV